MRISRRPLLAVGAGIVLLAILFLALRGRDRDVQYQTAVVDRGDVVDVVGATGTLQAVTTVQVGSQVSGTIQSLYADFNSAVRKGQVIARLDPSLFQARLGQARANLISARAGVDRARATREDTRQKLQRAQELAAQNLLPASDLETAKANHDGAVAQLKASEAAVSQAEASLNQAQVDLEHTVITAPIDGIVIARNVDVGQTVAASFQAPVLFVIANDLSRMQVSASVDEADIGRVRVGQEVSFRVDAFPEATFPGRVEQVRLQPTTVQNVVTYNTIISVENPDLRLMPGMTATVSVIIRRSDDVLRIPAAALRFRPEGFEPRRSFGGPTGGPGGAGAGGAGGPAARGAEAGERRRGPGPRADGSASEPPLRLRSRPNGEAPEGGREGQGQSNAGPGRGEEGGRPVLVFVLNTSGEPQSARVRIGISDGQFVEVRSGLEEGAHVVTGLEGGTRPGPPRAGASPSTNPFTPPQFQQRRR